MNGVLVVDKPSGPSSHDVVASVRRAISLERVGHTGTLDPLATGVLPLVIGRATRLAPFLTGADKEYVARVRFGATTDTYDAEGTPPSEQRPVPEVPGQSFLRTALPELDWPSAAPADETAIAEALPEFIGTYWQMPPPFSAKKIAGVPAYKLARLRKPVDLKPSQVTVREIELCGYQDEVAELRIVCSSGFYVRSLAHDLGERLGCGAYLEALRRTRAGEFTLADAAPLAAIQELGRSALSRLIPVDRLLTNLPSVVLSEQGVRRATHGNALSTADLVNEPASVARVLDAASSRGPAPRLRLIDSGGSLLAIAEPVEGGLLHPVIVLV
jgi:tRNA pseudouridine55 synthase